MGKTNGAQKQVLARVHFSFWAITACLHYFKHLYAFYTNCKWSIIIDRNARVRKIERVVRESICESITIEQESNCIWCNCTWCKYKLLVCVCEPFQHKLDSHTHTHINTVNLTIGCQWNRPSKMSGDWKSLGKWAPLYSMIGNEFTLCPIVQLIVVVVVVVVIIGSIIVARIITSSPQFHRVGQETDNSLQTSPFLP